MKSPALTLSAVCLSLAAFSSPAHAIIAVFAHTHWSGNGGGAAPTPGIWDHTAPPASGRLVSAQSIGNLQAGAGSNQANAGLFARADSNGVHAAVGTQAQSLNNINVVSRAGNTAGTVTQLFDPNAGESGAGAFARLVGTGCVISGTVGNVLTAMNFKLDGPVSGGKVSLSDNSVVTIGIGVMLEASPNGGLSWFPVLNQTGSATAAFGTNGSVAYSNRTGLLSTYTVNQPGGFAIKSAQFNIATTADMRLTLSMAIASESNPGLTGGANNFADFSHTFGFDPNVPVLDDLPPGVTFDAPDLNVSGNGFTAVPEPAGIALLALAGAAGLRRRFRA
jgi:hypothetical protein